MEDGYVYILSNPAMIGLIKIGHTRRSPEERARELSRNTSIPSNFLVEFEIFTVDRIELEKVVHTKLEAYRFNKKREFFKIDVDRASAILKDEAEIINGQQNGNKGFNTLFEKYEAVEILDKLKDKFPGMLRPKINSVRIYQTAQRCYLEITEETVLGEDQPIPLIDQLIKRRDLGFITNYAYDDDLAFDPERSVFDNVREFIEDFDPYSTVMTCSDLFTAEASYIIQDKHFSKDK